MFFKSRKLQLFKRPKTQVIQRVPIREIIQDLTTNYPSSGNQTMEVRPEEPTNDLKAIIAALYLPFDLNQAQFYVLNERATFAGGYFGNLLVGDNWAFLGKNWYEDGRAVNSEFAFRKEDIITLGYLNETCKITPDREIEVKLNKEKLQIELPEEYNPEKLFPRLPKEFTESVARGNASYSSFGPRPCAIFGKHLAGKKL